jgi:GT2 family glycosyltransferase
MTPQEAAFFEDLRALVKKHGPVMFDRAVPFENPGIPSPPAMRFVISMLAFNNLVLSKNCIESVLANSTPGTYRLILTNNGSTDGTKEYFDEMAKQFPQITVVHEGENTGFQAPNEMAFGHAMRMGATYFICLNNDAEVPAGWLEKLAQPLDASEKAVISGPLGGCSRLNPQMQGCDDTKLEYIEGSCMCVKIATIQKEWGRLFAPYLDFIYHEDSDLSLRVQYAGYTIHKAPFRITHRGSKTAGEHPEAKARCAAANARNEAVMLKKWAHWNRVRRFDHPIIVKRQYAVGDVLLTTPIIRALHEKYPLCEIWVQTDYPDIFKGNPCVAHAVKHDIMVQGAVPRDAMVIDLNMAYERTPGRHVVYSYAEVAGLDPMDLPAACRLEFYYSGTAANRGLAGRWLAMHIGPTSWPGKNWPNDRWNSVAQHFRKKGFKIMVLGSPPKDASILCDLDMRGQSGYEELAALMGQCEAVVGLDSFPAHLAAAIGRKCVVLYGITDPKCFAVSTAPYAAVCSDEKHPDTGRRNREPNRTFIQTDDSVMRTITVEAVVETVEEILK